MTLEQTYEHCREKLLLGLDMAVARTSDNRLVTLQKMGVDRNGEMLMRMRIAPA